MITKYATLKYEDAVDHDTGKIHKSFWLDRAMKQQMIESWGKFCTNPAAEIEKEETKQQRNHAIDIVIRLVEIVKALDLTYDLGSPIQVLIKEDGATDKMLQTMLTEKWNRSTTKIIENTDCKVDFSDEIPSNELHVFDQAGKTCLGKVVLV
jgi:hypothetical protein